MPRVLGNPTTLAGRIPLKPHGDKNTSMLFNGSC